ncbi:hypothetical protein GCM10025777_22060 [Membranihabitans marinus]
MVKAQKLFNQEIDPSVMPPNAYIFLDSHMPHLKDDLSKNYELILSNNDMERSILGNNLAHYAYESNTNQWINIISPNIIPPHRRPNCMAYNLSKVCSGGAGCYNYVSYKIVNNQLKLITQLDHTENTHSEYIVFPLMFHPENSETIHTMGKYYLKPGDKEKIESRLVDMLLGKLNLGVARDQYIIDQFHVIVKDIEWNHSH